MPNDTIKIATQDHCIGIATLIAKAFSVVAEQFQINSASHPSNCQSHWIEQDLNSGIEYFYLAEHSQIIACIALSTSQQGQTSLQRLAVDPYQQQAGLGTRLLEHGLQQAKAAASEWVEISIVAQHQQLANWYLKQGFVKTERKQFAKLPFAVQYFRYYFRGLVIPMQAIIKPTPARRIR